MSREAESHDCLEARGPHFEPVSATQAHPDRRGLTGIVYADDHQVSELHLYRVYDPEKPRIETRVCTKRRARPLGDSRAPLNNAPSRRALQTATAKRAMRFYQFAAPSL